MSAAVIPIVYGQPVRSAAGSESEPAARRRARRGWSLAGESWWSVVPPLLLAVAVLVLGLYLPPELRDVLQRAASAVGAE
jgi:hypothetical protein